MRAYIQTDKKGNFFNVNAHVAYEGFEHMGWETFKFQNPAELTDNEPEHVVVGGIVNVRKALQKFGIAPPESEIDYPDSLQHYLGRRIWASTMEEVFQQKEQRNIFVKPRTETKKFVGMVVKQDSDFIGLLDFEKPTQVWCSELVSFKTEWRCFIRYGEILDIRRYRGAWDTKPDVSIIRNAVKEFQGAPAAYGLDFGLDENETMKLVEVNDGHSLGTYGLGPVLYAKFLSARWAEMTRTTDYANF